MLMGRMGRRRGAAKRAAARRVPSPPRTRRRSDWAAICSRERELEGAGRAQAVSSSKRTRRLRASSQRRREGMTTERLARRGREMTPMVWNFGADEGGVGGMDAFEGVGGILRQSGGGIVVGI